MTFRTHIEHSLFSASKLVSWNFLFTVAISDKSLVRSFLKSNTFFSFSRCHIPGICPKVMLKVLQLSTRLAHKTDSLRRYVYSFRPVIITTPGSTIETSEKRDAEWTVQNEQNEIFVRLGLTTLRTITTKSTTKLLFQSFLNQLRVDSKN